MSDPTFRLGIQGPGLRDHITGSAESVDESGPAKSCLVGIDDDEDATGLRDAVRLFKRAEHAIFVKRARGLFSTLPVCSGDALLLLRRQLSGEVFWVEEANCWPQPHVARVR